MAGVVMSLSSLAAAIRAGVHSMSNHTGRRILSKCAEIVIIFGNG